MSKGILHIGINYIFDTQRVSKKSHASMLTLLNQ